MFPNLRGEIQRGKIPKKDNPDLQMRGTPGLHLHWDDFQDLPKEDILPRDPNLQEDILLWENFQDLLEEDIPQAEDHIRGAIQNLPKEDIPDLRVEDIPQVESFQGHPREHFLQEGSQGLLEESHH